MLCYCNKRYAFQSTNKPTSTDVIFGGGSNGRSSSLLVSTSPIDRRLNTESPVTWKWEILVPNNTQNSPKNFKSKKQNLHYLSENSILLIKPITPFQRYKKLTPVWMWPTRICTCNQPSMVKSQTWMILIRKYGSIYTFTTYKYQQASIFQLTVSKK